MTQSDDAPIDMTRTMAPEVTGFRAHIEEGLRQVAQLPDLSALVQRHRFHGTERDRHAAAEWLGQRLGFVPSTQRLLMTGGTQNILMILLPHLVPHGSVLATERLTYAAITQLANLAGIEIAPVEIDDQGMIPEALEDLCRSGKVSALYTNPTGHNPTTSIMPTERRRALAAIADKYDVALIEDDVHGFITREAPAPIASIAGARTWYIMTTSKCLGIGLRTAYLVAPDGGQLGDLMKRIPSVSAWFVPALSAALVTHLIETGAAREIASRICDEIGERQDIAQSILGPLDLMHGNHSSLHIWLDLPPAWKIEDLVDAAAEEGVTLRHPHIFATPGAEIRNNLRLSLIAPVTHADLKTGLTKVAGLLQSRL